jgi:DNA-directed RNA polymerase specialized sigma24 family protein
MTCHQQLEELLDNQEFLRIVDLVAKEVMRFWNIPYTAARSFVLSAIGEPETLSRIHSAWSAARQTGELGLAKLIVRRRVIDLLRKDARPSHHCSLPATADAIDATPAPATFGDLVQRDPRLQLELQQIIHMVRGAVACFAAQGRIQERQARLLHRYALDDESYADLAAELGSSAGALRVRVHKAMLALRKHIQACHPELEDLLERDHRSPRPDSDSGHVTAPAVLQGERGLP